MSGKDIILNFGMDILNEICSNYGNDLKKIAFNFITDTIESALVGKRTLDEWAEIVIEVIDNIKDRTISENDYKFLGGTLKFRLSSNSKPKVIIAYELYFIDSNGNYFKNSAKSDVNQDNFIQEDINAIKEAIEIAYEVEE
ncbi:MAG: hypothetical protein HFE49_07510 [Clostridia bacterium]|nr:hypothetical protein [Clostridia bacterium]